MTKVLISGYYGFNNLGDEAILFSMVNSLRQVEPGLEITVLSARPEATAASYGVKAVNRWHPLVIWKALRGSDLLISGGGSLLQDVTGLFSLVYYLGVIGLARLARKPVFVYAQGIGPVNSALGQRLVRMVFNRVKAITVRDEDSRRELLQMGVKKSIEVTADPVLALRKTAVDTELGKAILRQAGLGWDPGWSTEEQTGPGARIVGISLREWQGQTAFKTAVASLGDKLARAGYQVVFLPMQDPYDTACSREVMQLMQEPACLVERQLSVPEVAAVIANLTLVVGMRLHALILAAALGVPAAAIAYDPKIDRFMAALQRKSAINVDNPDADKLWQEVQALLAHPAQARQQTERTVEPLRNLAARTAYLALGMERIRLNK